MFSLRPHQQDAFEMMLQYQKGQLIMPTGSGKTLCMIFDAMREYRSDTKTIMVVAPRILLTQQLRLSSWKSSDYILNYIQSKFFMFIVEKQNITLQLIHLEYLFGQQKTVHTTK